MGKTEQVESLESLCCVPFDTLQETDFKGNHLLKRIFTAYLAFVSFDMLLTLSASHQLSILINFASQTSKIYVFNRVFRTKND